MAALQSHKDKLAVAIEVCAAIQILATQYDHAAKIGQCGGCAAIVEALRIHLNDDSGG